MTPEAGQRFGPYEILGRLGSGGMALVFRAWDERLHREVAVKLLREDYSIPAMRERFLQEARAASGLNHPNICTIFDIGDQDGNPYLVMELLQGETLKERIERGALPSEEIVRYAEEIAGALSLAHAKGIVHRDIKPANIFLVALGGGKIQAKVLDFGLAKIGLEMGGGWASRSLDLTLAGRTVGTLAYMSPEQARGEALDARTDLFSLGVVMYEMATRRPPFQGANSAVMFTQLFGHEPEPVHQWNEKVPRELERVISKLLEKDRRARFQTADELRAALEKIPRPWRGWLQRGAASVVPLVRASDPVARQRKLKSKLDSPVREGEGPVGRGEATSAGLPVDETAVDFMEGSEARSAALDGSEPRPSSEEEREQAAAWYSGENASGVFPEDESAGGTAVRGETQRRPRANDSRQETPAFQQAPGARERAVEGLEGTTSGRAWEVGAETEGRGKRGWVRAAVLTAAAGASIAALFLVLRSGVLRPLVLRPSDRLLLTVIENKTGDKTLDGVVMQGIEIALRQSDSLAVQGGEVYAAGLRQLRAEGADVAASSLGQSVAQKVGAKAYLYGRITGSKPPYELGVEVLKADTNDEVASMEEEAANRDELPAAIGRMAEAIRREISQDSKLEMRRSVRFGQDTTASVEALRAFADGEAAMQAGRPEEALAAFQRAAALDPKFVQAQLRLSWIYRGEKAELASGIAAERARGAAAKAGNKVKRLAQFCYEMNAAGDLTSAATTMRAYLKRYPRDQSGREAWVRLLLAQGQFPEALAAAQHEMVESPFERRGYDAAQEALLGLDRYESVLELAAAAKRAGVIADEGVLAAAYLGGRGDVLALQISEVSNFVAGGKSAASVEAAGGGAEVGFAKLADYARYLDSTGRLGPGLEVWKKAAARAERTPELSSAAASMLAQGALDRAVAESCTVALAMVEQLRDMPKGPEATYRAGMAAALCGDQTYALKAVMVLQQQFPRHTKAIQQFVPELEAAAALGVNEARRTLEILPAAGREDKSAFRLYLRGQAYAATGQKAEAQNDLQMVLSHRGAAWMAAGTLYPITEVDLGRVYVTEKDKADSAASYRDFLQTWDEADRRQPLMREAAAKSR